MTNTTPRFTFWILAAAITLLLAACSETTPVVPEQTADLEVTVQGSGNGTVTSDPAGINCGTAAANCANAFDVDTTVTLTAVAAAGSTFSGWGGACSGTAATCEVEVTEDTTVVAAFTLNDPDPDPDPDTFTVTVAEPANGTVSSDDGNVACGDGSVDCAFTYEDGTEVTLTATPAAGFQFSGWNGGPCDGTATNPCTFTVGADHQITATFVAEGVTPGSFTGEVSQGSDDAEEFVNDPGVVGFPAGTTYTNSSDLEMSYDTGSGTGANQVVGLRFTGVTIPANATITDAYIQFTAKENDSGNTSLTIYAQDDANPGTFVAAESNNDISSRARTSASVGWTPAAWTAGQAGMAERTPNIAELVQEVVDMGGWAEGNAIAFILTGPDSPTNKRTARSFEAGFAPVLVVDYTVP